ncbi:PREDICTED: uncharacterized protein LOC107070932 isoform X1 [Polistes dominula]|uniref:Uncharacterized protein LOC107070932 isoform X1 n=1 Tax=Polistes dominula TaxID=743375 RepID=A0ABM1IXP2_POLDO|nr:PREDICTED: uncharacterized protein LOC107070932 isoform X1 [Polistes dominula]
MVAMQILLLFYLSMVLHKKDVANAMVTVEEVAVGHLAQLPCQSNDDQHRFMFWQLTDDSRIIGPGNPIDVNKYNYEVLTGTLYIRGVSTAEAGFYKCISRGLNDHSSVNVHVVELIVKKNWEDVWENDFETNLLRGMAAVMVVVVAIAVILLIVIVKRKRNQGFFDLDESRDNSPERFRGNIINTSAAVPAQGIVNMSEDGGIENPTLDIDFPKLTSKKRNRLKEKRVLNNRTVLQFILLKF